MSEINIDKLAKKYLKEKVLEDLDNIEIKESTKNKPLESPNYNKESQDSDKPLGLNKEKSGMVKASSHLAVG